MKDFKLDEHPKITTGFKTPDGYFDNLAQQVMEKLPKTDVKVISISKRRNSWVFTAAAVLILSLMIPVLNKIPVSTPQPDGLAFENYIAYHSEISDDDIVDLLESEDIQKIAIDYDLDENDLEEALSGKNIENYITE